MLNKVNITLNKSCFKFTEIAEQITCDESKPLTPHESDCSRYYQCAQTGLGLELIEKECAPGTWYNPETMMCDWPYNVKLIRPECTG